MSYSVIEERFLSHIYSMSFNKEQESVLNTLKYYHTYRVVDLSKVIALSVFGSDSNSLENVELSKIIAILHDIGRWEQMKSQGSFSDVRDDHGESGVSIVEKENILVGLEPYKQKIVLSAIREHNKKYASTHDEYTQKFISIIRDADKIDNFHVEVENYNNDAHSMKNILPFSDEHTLSPVIFDNIMNAQLSDSKDRKTKIDFKFFKMAWCFDIKLSKSIEIIKEKRYIQNMFSAIQNPDKNMIVAYQKICAYLENTI